MASSSSKVPWKHTSKCSFWHLPVETQKQIFSYLGRRDLLFLQVVSKQFHDLASARIYRDLDFNLISDEAEDTGNAASRAADALQTVLTSDYDYGQHIKSFRLGALGADRYVPGIPLRGRTALEDQLLKTRLLWDSKTDPSKLLNTALLLMARKTNSLETFKWDAPIELSNAVYRSLHQVKSLRHLLVRLDVQPAPRFVQRHTQQPNPSIPPLPGHFTYAQNGSYPSYPPTGDFNGHKRKKATGAKFWERKWAFSGFQYLSTLEVVGLTNLDCLPEVAQCIKASSATLKSLTLSLSSDLAGKARRPLPISNLPHDDVSDTELDEDEMDIPPDPSSTILPPQETDVREEKSAQDNILITVFDLQSVAQVGKKLEKKLSLVGGKCLEDDEVTVLQEELLAELEDLKNTPLELGQAKKMKGLLNIIIKNQSGHSKKAGLNQKGKRDKEAHKATLGKKKHVPNAGLSNFKPANSNYVNVKPFLYSSSSMDGDASLSNVTQPPFPISHTNGKPPSFNHHTLWTGDVPSSKPSPLGPLIDLNKHPADSYSSSSLSGSSGYTFTPNPTAQYSSYTPNHDSSGSITPTVGVVPYNAYGVTHPMSVFGQSPHGTGQATKIVYTSSKKSKHPKSKKHATKKFEPPKPASLPSSDDSEADRQGKFPLDLGVFSPKGDEQPIEAMNVDVDHPDEDISDIGEDQEYVAGPETDHPDDSMAKSRHPPMVAASSTESNETVEPSSSANSATNAIEDAVSDTSVTKAMQDYIRVTHGLPFEELRLQWIPMKAAILAKALDLTVLQRITLLDVGPQDTFWALLVRLAAGNRAIAFKSIHTDHTSKAFIKFLTTYEGLEELFLHERGGKHSDGDPGYTVELTDIRKSALSHHASSLKKLMLRNELNDFWDLDSATLQFLALKARQLTELACSIKLATFHTLIQMFKAFKSLYALHVIQLRSTDRNITLQIECLAFAIDAHTISPSEKLSYVALGENVDRIERRPDQAKKRKIKKILESGIDRKGKGKAIDFLSPGQADTSDGELEDLLADMATSEARRRTTHINEIKGVKVFTKEIRTGRL